MEKLKGLYLADDAGDGATAEWNEVRANVLEEALQTQLYPTLEDELLNIRCRYSKDLLLAKCVPPRPHFQLTSAALVKLRRARRCQERLEGMLRVAPYSWSRDQDSKPVPAQAIMAVALGEPSECVVIDSWGEVPARPAPTAAPPLPWRLSTC